MAFRSPLLPSFVIAGTTGLLLAVTGCSRSEDPSDSSASETLRQVSEIVAVVGKVPVREVDPDQPILDLSDKLGESELLDIFIEIEDRFGIEIEEDAIERATGGRFDDIKGRLTPRQLGKICEEAARE